MSEDRTKILLMKDMKPMLKLKVYFQAMVRVKARRHFEERTRDEIARLRDINSLRGPWALWRAKFTEAQRESNLMIQSKLLHESSRLVGSYYRREPCLLF